MDCAEGSCVSQRGRGSSRRPIRATRVLQGRIPPRGVSSSPTAIDPPTHVELPNSNHQEFSTLDSGEEDTNQPSTSSDLKVLLKSKDHVIAALQSDLNKIRAMYEEKLKEGKLLTTEIGRLREKMG